MLIFSNDTFFVSFVFLLLVCLLPSLVRLVMLVVKRMFYKTLMLFWLNCQSLLSDLVIFSLFFVRLEPCKHLEFVRGPPLALELKKNAVHNQVDIWEIAGFQRAYWASASVSARGHSK